MTAGCWCSDWLLDSRTSQVLVLAAEPANSIRGSTQTQQTMEVSAYDCPCSTHGEPAASLYHVGCCMGAVAFSQQHQHAHRPMQHRSCIGRQHCCCWLLMLAVVARCCCCRLQSKQHRSLMSSRRLTPFCLTSQHEGLWMITWSE